MKALLNGKDSISLHTDDIISAEFFLKDSDQMSYLVISRPSLGWKVQLDDIRPVHLSQHTTSLQGDFFFLYWEARDILCLAGYKRFYAIDGKSGRIMSSQTLAFTDKESLDFLSLLVNLTEEKFIVVSTKVALLIDGNTQSPREIIIPGLADSVSMEGNGFKITYLDTTKLDLPTSILVVD